MKGFTEGLKNLKFPKEEVERIAKLRAKKALGCNKNKPQLKMLSVTDKNIPELSGRMCSGCKCNISILIRQDIKICECWKNIRF